MYASRRHCTHFYTSVLAPHVGGLDLWDFGVPALTACCRTEPKLRTGCGNRRLSWAGDVICLWGATQSPCTAADAAHLNTGHRGVG